MAPRANWKGFLRLSLVTCPVAPRHLRFRENQINRNTGPRIKYLKVDADTGEEVASEDIMKGYKVDTDSSVKVTKDMHDLAKHIVNQKTSTFEPEKFEDHYEAALTELINQKRSGKPITAKARPKGENVVDLMDALKRSIANDRGAEPSKGRKPRKAAAGQKEMLLPISGKRVAKAETKKEKPAASRARKRA
jgi:non-homologous end joining protein Ku